MGTSCCVCDSHNNNDNIFVFESNEFGTVNSHMEHSIQYGSERLSRDQKIKQYKHTLSSGDLLSNLSTNTKRSENHYRKSQSMVIPEEQTKDVVPIEKDIQIKLENDSQCGVNNGNNNNCNSNSNNVKEHNDNDWKSCLQLPPKAPKKTKATKLKKKKMSNINNHNMNTNENDNKCKDIFEKYKYVFDEPTTATNATTNTQKSRSRSKSKTYNTINAQNNNSNVTTQTNHVNCLSIQSENSKQPLTEQN